MLDRLAAEHGVERRAIAVAFLLRHPARILPVLGANALPGIARTAEALQVRLTRVQWFQIYEAAIGQEVP